MELLPLAIATLTAFAALAVLWAAGESLAARPPTARQTLAVRLRPWLRAAAPPAALRRRWGGAEVARRLETVEAPWDVVEYVGLRWLLVLLAAALALALGFARGWDLLAWFLALVVVLSAMVGPAVWLSLRQEARQQGTDRSLPDFLDRLALGMGAGLGFEVALRRSAAQYPGRLGEELRRMVRQLDRGHSRSQALEELAARNPSDDLRAFVAAVRQADRLGTSLAKALRVQSSVLRNRRRRRAQEASRRLPILIVFPLVFFFLPALLIVYLAPPLLHLFLGR